MPALVAYKSIFGNTRAVAEAVAAGPAPMNAALVAVGEASTTLPDNVNLLIVDGPTHAFVMTGPRPRQDAVSRSAVSAGRIGIREWSAHLNPPRDGMAAATLDTRIRTPRVPGSAARGGAKRLRSLGFDLVVQSAFRASWHRP